MDLTSQAAVQANERNIVSEQKEKELPPVYVSMVDPFLVEALQNPRHRLTILRMELDIQKFLQNSDQQQFDFPHFPTSYIRLAAHRVAQHYGLLTMVQDNVADGKGIGILVMKKPDSKFPAVCLSDIPAKESDNEKLDEIKFAIRLRASKTSSNDANELGIKQSSIRTVEERKEEYDRARARIFSSSSGSESEGALARVAAFDGRNFNADEFSRNLDVDGDKSTCSRDRVAIFRDREKDRTDPDYDRSYERYVKNIPSTQSFSLGTCNIQEFQPPFVQYDSILPQLQHMPATQASLNYSSSVMSPYCAMGLNQTSMDPLHMQWQNQSMMYAQSYDQMRRTFIQAPFSQQPLSFDYSQNH